jgi:hypothetical protein
MGFESDCPWRNRWIARLHAPWLDVPDSQSVERRRSLEGSATKWQRYHRYSKSIADGSQTAVSIRQIDSRIKPKKSIVGLQFRHHRLSCHVCPVLQNKGRTPL